MFVYDCNVRKKRFISSSVKRFCVNLSLSVYLSLNNFFQPYNVNMMICIALKQA